jgi:hypothetical protein
VAKQDLWKLAQSSMTGDILKTEQFEATWAEWCQYRRELRKRLTPCSIRRQIHKLEGFGHNAAIASIERSIENGWQGLFEPPDDSPRVPQRVETVRQRSSRPVSDATKRALGIDDGREELERSAGEVF